MVHSHLDGDIEEAELGLGLGGEVRRLQLVGHHLQDRHCELVEPDTLVGENIRLADQEPLVDKNSKETKAYTSSYTLGFSSLAISQTCNKRPM